MVKWDFNLSIENVPLNKIPYKNINDKLTNMMLMYSLTGWDVEVSRAKMDNTIQYTLIFQELKFKNWQLTLIFCFDSDENFKYLRISRLCLDDDKFYDISNSLYSDGKMLDATTEDEIEILFDSTTQLLDCL